MELVIGYYMNNPREFCTWSRLVDQPFFRQSVFTLDYEWTPWPRYNGNLLWQ